jgi:hypothetical protein
MRPQSWGLSVLLVVFLATGCSKQPATARVVPPVPAPVGQSDLNPAVAAPPGATGTTPRDAVEKFVQGLIDIDATGTYALLTDRERFGTSVAAWQQSMAALPTYRSFSVVRNDPVEVEAVFEPRVDEEVGVVPEKAVVHFATTSESGGWRVSLARTTIEPQYPNDAAAAAAVALKWAKANQACDEPARRSLQYQGSLLGQPSMVGELCKWSGTLAVSGTADLNSTAAAASVRNAFGPTADEWANVARIDGPRPLDVVTAPLGDSWVVVAVSGR